MTGVMGVRMEMGSADVPKSWWYILGGFSFLAFAAILAAGLLVQYLANRPVNLQAHTALLADTLEKTLAERFVPAGHIHRGPLVTELDPENTVSWTFQRFEVELPRSLNPDGLKQLVHADLLPLDVSIVDVPERNAVAAWSLSRGSLEFARVVMKYPAGEPQRKEDLREESHVLADVIEDALRKSGVLEDTIVRSAPDVREDEKAQWGRTRFSAVLPPDLSAGDLRVALEAALTFDGAAVNSERAGYGVSLRVTQGGREFIEVLCTPAPAEKRVIAETPVEPPEPAPESLMAPMEMPPAELTKAPLPPPEEMNVALEAPRPAPIKEMTVPASETPAPDAKASRPIKGAPGPASPVPPPPRGQAPEPAPIEEMSAQPSETPAPEPSEETLAAKKPAKEVRIAIILDDGGNNHAQCERVLALDTNMTLSILPHTPFGRETAIEAAKLGFEVMLHMPMETESKTENPGPGKIMTDMEEREIQLNTMDALSTVPGAVGVNNHTGSKFTKDAKAMRAFLAVLKEKHLYFIDSWTSDASVAYDTAVAMGIRAGSRDVFLDDDRTAPAVARQFDALLAHAKKHGGAIGIGHFQSPHTLSLLEDKIPGLEEKGVRLVHVSELL